MSVEQQSGHPVDIWLTDMDGVLVHEEVPIPGAADFITRLEESEQRYLVLTNNSIFTPRDLVARLARYGIELSEDAIWTSALATAGSTRRDQVSRFPYRATWVVDFIADVVDMVGPRD